MNLSRYYRRGILVVLYTILGSSVPALLVARSSTSPPRAAQDLGDQAQDLGAFELIERSGRTITEFDLVDRVWIASFIFTRCPLSCPRISSVMKSLQEKLKGSRVLLVSVSVDPDHDTPPVLDAYARGFGAEPDRWWFLTGSRPLIYELIERRFKLSVMVNPAPDPEGNDEAIAHSDRLALVDRGRVVGLFDSKDPAALDDLIKQAKRRAQASWVRGLPTVNASLNALCAILLVSGWILIRRRVPGPGPGPDLGHAGSSAGGRSTDLSQPPIRGHICCMALAVITSALFLICYLVYHYHAGSVSFQGQGPIRMLYFTVLISHTVLATFGVVPLVLNTLLRAVRRDFFRHRTIAAVTFPIWLYVSVTGVVIYLMLYHTPVASSSPLPMI
jgi:protein SCO1/2/putative membrane protein